MNVSKKGVSMTFGVRGASITTGKNGTYLNTSIPGTGIYKRQKISGEKSKTHNHIPSNDGITNNILSPAQSALAISWIVLITIALLIVLQNIVIGVCFILGVIIFKVATASKKKELESNDQINTVEESHYDNVVTTDVLLKKEDMYHSKKYYSSIAEEVEKIFSFYENLSNDDIFIRQLKYKMKIYDLKKQIFMLFCGDMSKCLFELGCGLDLKNKGFGFFYFIARYNMGLKKFDYDQAISLLVNNYQKIIDLVVDIQSNVKTLPINDIFFISTILGEYDDTQRQKYLMMIYHYASTIAKIDGIENEKEMVWLNTILSFSNKSTQKNKHISKEYFTSVSEEVEKIILFYESLCSDTNFMYFFSSKTNLDITISGEIQDSKGQLRTLLWYDMTKCLRDLGHELNLKSIEGFGLFYLFIRTVDGKHDRFEYEYLDFLFTEKLFDASTHFAVQISHINFGTENADEIFTIAKILNDYNVNLKQKYLIMLYRYASLTAKADGTIDEKEAEWLSKILSVSQKPARENVRVLNNEQDTSEIQQTLNRNIKPKTSALRALIGLESVKEEIETLTNFIKIQREREAKGLKKSLVSYHCVFTGNPGTGKTTVARIVADIYKSLGILKKGHLVETDRSGLVAEYVGQTAVKTNKIIDDALDGVLFIDEAYSLISKSENDYGKEAIATLLKRMEDDRERLVVILAGYTAEMQNFIDSNPGLQSRFNRYIEFPDYSAEELFKVFELRLREDDYIVTNDAKNILQEYLKNKVANKDKYFGNARFARNLFDKTIEKQANRLAKEAHLTKENYCEICSIDLPI